MAFSSSKSTSSQRPGQLGLPYAGGPEKDEAADRAGGVLQPGASTDYRIRHSSDGFVLTYHAQMQVFFQAALVLLSLSLLESVAPGSRSHRLTTARYVILRHFFLQQARLTLFL